MEYREFLAAEDKQFRAHLEEHQRVIGGVLEEVKAQGERIAVETAQTVKASGREAVAQVQTSLEQVAQAAHQVGELAQRASKATEEAAQRSEGLLGRMDQASQRMVSSEQAVEGALNALLPKVGAIREGLEKELGDSVRAAAAMEDEVKKMVGSIRSSLTKEIESEIRTKLLQAANDASHRIYTLGDWWERFTKFGIPLLLLFFAAVSGLLGWWFGKHQLEEDTYQKAIERMRANAQVNVYAYKFFPGPAGELKHDLEFVTAPLVWLGNGKYAAMSRNAQGQWVYGEIVAPRESLLLAEAYDSTRKNDNLIKAKQP